VRATFTLSVPTDWDKPAQLTLARRSLVLPQGSAVDVTCTSRAGVLDLPFKSSRIVFRYSGLFRRLSVQLTRFSVHDVPAGAATAGCSFGGGHAAPPTGSSS
jgi:hypothetical protein